jgi:biotin-(acetyl-CoA carboxylase) ligase
LVETRTGHNSFAVVGIGLNINHVSEDFPEELRSCACSLAMILGAPLKRHEVAVRLMENLGVREKLIMADPELLLCSWNEMLLKDFTA